MLLRLRRRKENASVTPIENAGGGDQRGRETPAGGEVPETEQGRQGKSRRSSGGTKQNKARGLYNDKGEGRWTDGGRDGKKKGRG